MSRQEDRVGRLATDSVAAGKRDAFVGLLTITTFHSLGHLLAAKKLPVAFRGGQRA